MEHFFPSSLPRGSHSGGWGKRLMLLPVHFFQSGPCRLAVTIAAVSAAAARSSACVDCFRLDSIISSFKARRQPRPAVPREP